MSHKHRHVLQALFAHPVSSNIDPRQVFAMIEALGGELGHGGHGQMVVKLNGHTHGFHDTRHTFSKEEVAAVRKFLELAGIGPDTAFAGEASAALAGNPAPGVARRLPVPKLRAEPEHSTDGARS